MPKWKDLQPLLRQMIGDEEFETWLNPLHSVRENTDSLTLSSDKPIIVAWVRDHFLNDLEAVARSRYGRSFRVHLTEPTTVPNEISSPVLSGQGQVLTQEPLAGAPLPAGADGCRLWLGRR